MASLKSFVIRHGPPLVPWDSLDYPGLVGLLRQEYDPCANKAFLEKSVDRQALRRLQIRAIYSSSLLRAVDTAGFFAGLLNVNVYKLPELNELLFGGLPESVYNQGADAVRQYLFSKSLEANIVSRLKSITPLLTENVLFVSHGFLMQLLFMRLFCRDAGVLQQGNRFTHYLAGFDCISGNPVSLMQ